MPDKNYEILAPVGSYESLFAAVRSGADAVYFGLKDFSARRNAENLTDEEMISAVKYCKRNGVKVYLTLNIAVKDRELQNAFEAAKKAYFAGVDGFIISDLGLAEMIRASMPDIELHASTQMTVNSPSPLSDLKKLGFCRVVAAREMNKKELAALCDKAKELGMEVEVFVHGALCMCLSGQCLMSSVLGGRSGNRGLCAGPCRLPFSAEGGTGYDLSLKDLSLFEHLEELVKMGVYSFKIEGRMKRPEYIAAAVTACKAAAKSGSLDEETAKTLEGVFSRSGFTDGYFTGKIGKEMFGVRQVQDFEKSKKLHNSIHDIYRNEYQRIPVSINARLKSGEAVKITFSSGKKTVSVSGDIPSFATNKPLKENDVKTLLSKLGGTPYFAKSVDVELDAGLFVPTGEINNLRRNCVEKLGEEFERIPKRSFFDKSFVNLPDFHKSVLKLYGDFSFVTQIPKDTSKLDLIILPIESYKKIGDIKTEMAVKLPKFIMNEDKLISDLKAAKESGVIKAVCPTLPTVAVAKRCGMEIIGDIGLNVLNSENIKVLKTLGVTEITLSAEIDVKSAVSINSPLKKGIFGYGRLPLMATKNCPVRNGKSCDKCGKDGKLTDRYGIEFPVGCRNGYCEILNSKPLYLADKLEDFSGLDFITLSFTTENAEESQMVINDYLTHAPAKGDFTRGLYYRELL